MRLALITLVMAAATLTARAQELSSQPINTMCPIGKESIVESAGTVVYKGNTIGLCCPGCGEEFLGWDEHQRDEFVALAKAGREPGRERAAPSVPPDGTIIQIGTMREVLREGKSDPRLLLADVRSDAVGVGALAGLAGEITIVDGNVWVTRTDGQTIKTTGPAATVGEQATLLTIAHVPAWTTITIGHGSLESVIEEQIAAAGLDLDQPIPFVIETEAADLRLHVINGVCPEGADASKAAPWRWSGTRPAKIVGIYARDRAGVMTHHASNLHAHAVITWNGATVTGHIDAATILKRAALRLPAPNAAPRLETSNTAAEIDHE